MFLTLNHICPNNLPLQQSVTKLQQTNEHMKNFEYNKTTTSHKSLNSYSLVEYNKIYPNTNSRKTLQEERKVCKKRKPKHIIMDQSQNKIESLFFINLDRCLSVEVLSSSCQAAGLEQLLKLNRCQLPSFNDRHFSDLNLGQICMVSTLDLETKFFEVLNTSQIYPNTSKVHFVKGFSQLYKIVTYVPNK